MASVFTKIVRGEIPCYKIYEDEKTMAFLDIEPEEPGHTLVIPKVEIGKLYDLPDEDYNAVMATVKKLAKHMEKVLGNRIIIKVYGVDLPDHAHVHLMPMNKNWAGERVLKPTPEEFEEMRQKLELK